MHHAVGTDTNSAQAATLVLEFDFLTLTSWRFLTVKPLGSVPLAIMRSGHRLHFGFDVQHFFFGFGGIGTRLPV